MFSNGENYLGAWENGKRNGFGEQTWTCGTNCEGVWVDDQMEGHFHCLDKDMEENEYEFLHHKKKD